MSEQPDYTDWLDHGWGTPAAAHQIESEIAAADAEETAMSQPEPVTTTSTFAALVAQTGWDATRLYSAMNRLEDDGDHAGHYLASTAWMALSELELAERYATTELAHVQTAAAEALRNLTDGMSNSGTRVAAHADKAHEHLLELDRQAKTYTLTCKVLDRHLDTPTAQ